MRIIGMPFVAVEPAVVLEADALVGAVAVGRGGEHGDAVALVASGAQDVECHGGADAATTQLAQGDDVMDGGDTFTDEQL